MRALRDVLSAPLVATLLFAACSGGGGGGAAGGPSGAGTGELTLLATDATISHSMVAAARIAVSEIRIRTQEGPGMDEGEFLVLYSGAPIQLDLLELQNGVTRTLVQADLPARAYDQIRLVFSDAYLKLKNGNEYVTGDGSLKLTSQAKSGLKLNLSPAMQVVDGVSSEFLLDVDLTKTFLPVPGNDPLNAKSFKLLPVIKVANLSESGEVSGSVLEDDGAGGLQGVADVTVYLLEPGEADLGNAITTTASGANGFFALLGVAPGTYDLAASDGELGGRVQGITVAAGSVTHVDIVVAAPGP